MLCLLSELPSPKECRMGEGAFCCGFLCSHSSVAMSQRQSQLCSEMAQTLSTERARSELCELQGSDGCTAISPFWTDV